MLQYSLLWYLTFSPLFQWTVYMSSVHFLPSPYVCSRGLSQWMNLSSQLSCFTLPTVQVQIFHSLCKICLNVDYSLIFGIFVKTMLTAGEGLMFCCCRIMHNVGEFVISSSTAEIHFQSEYSWVRNKSAWEVKLIHRLNLCVVTNHSSDLRLTIRCRPLSSKGRNPWYIVPLEASIILCTIKTIFHTWGYTLMDVTIGKEYMKSANPSNWASNWFMWMCAECKYEWIHFGLSFQPSKGHDVATTELLWFQCKPGLQNEISQSLCRT